jgi:K+-transporting ATPase ATPase C chain
MTITRVSSLDQSGGGWLSAVRFAFVAIILTGLAFPLFATALGQALFPTQARGSLIVRDGVAVGSSLVAQPFAADKYFQPRPSAASFDPRAMSGSNWAPSNPALRERIETSSQAIAAREGVAATAIPVDLVTASGSGIDPHISPAAAHLQVARVAKVRGLSIAEVQGFVDANTLTPTFGVLGQSRVNVLELNLALDAHNH